MLLGSDLKIISDIYNQNLDLRKGGIHSNGSETPRKINKIFIRYISLFALQGAITGSIVTGKFKNHQKEVWMSTFLGCLAGSVFFTMRAHKKVHLTDRDEDLKKRTEVLFEKVFNGLDLDQTKLSCPITLTLFDVPVRIKCGDDIHIFEYNQIGEWIEGRKEGAKCPLCMRRISLASVELASEKRQEVSSAISEELQKKLLEMQDNALTDFVKKFLYDRNKKIDELYKGSLMCEWRESLKIYLS